MQAMHISWDEGTEFEVPAEPEPRYFSTLAEAVEFWVKLSNCEPVASVPHPAQHEELVIEIARELYDRFVMGGWEPQDAYPSIRGWLNGDAADRVQAFWDAQAEWSQATFGTDQERDHIGPLKHLAKEAVEAQVRPADSVEIADCLFLVFDAARRSGMTLDMLIEIAEKKLIVNKARQWNMPTDDNPVEHVRLERLRTEK